VWSVWPWLCLVVAAILAHVYTAHTYTKTDISYTYTHIHINVDG
jgi:hypothetical protein